MSQNSPILMTYDDTGFKFSGRRWKILADQRYVAGQQYRMTDEPQRSSKSHAHLFAIIRAAWLTLPEELALEFPTSEHLRAWLLIRAGHCTIMKIPCPDREMAMTVSNACRALDDFAVVMLADNVITVSRAKSIAYRELSAKQFQVIKSAVMDILADMLHITTEQLKDADKPAAQEHTALEYLGAP